MEKIKKICFIMSGYPVPGDMMNTFVDALICEMSRQGIEATVIAPFDVLRYLRKKGKKRPRRFIKKVDGGNDIHICCPPFIGAMGNKWFTKISQKIYNGVVLREFGKIRKTEKIDAVYGHFFTVGGVPAQLIGKKYGIPSFVACGESSLSKAIKYEDKKVIENCVRGLTGIICVSTKNKNEIYDLIVKNSDISVDEKIDVFPNAFNPNEFYPMEKESAASEAGLSASDFTVCFTGRFAKHKGIGVLSEALKKCPGVRSIFIGSGPVKPECDGIDYCGPVDHNKICKYLCASDVFVLPTKAEGCCNAIVEALGCGLPVISSDLPFNYDILDETNSILINPESADEIADAIMKLKNDKMLLEKLKSGSLSKGQTLTLEKRAKNILKFMEDNITKEQK